MDTIDNQTIVKLVVVVAVAYVLYRAYVKRNENYTPQYTALNPTTDMTTPQPPLYLAPMSVATDLLPKPVQGFDDFTEYAPKGNLQGMNFLDPSAICGVDTQGSSRRNANLQLRRDPECPKGPVPPAPVSDIEPDRFRKPIDDCY